MFYLWKCVFMEMWFCGLVEMWFCVFVEMWFCVNFIVNQKHEEHGYYLRVLRVIH